jgi:small-conductance mechanosensitive channel/CRP-like cAMP-binding protein
MALPSLSALAAAGGVLAALELAYLLVYRRHFQRLLERLRFQLWALLAAALAWLALEGRTEGRAGRIVVFAFALVSVDLGFRLLDRFWLSRLRDARGRMAVPKLVRDLAGWVLLFVTVLVAGHLVFDVGYAKFLLPSAVVSAVLGFALQDVLKNVFAGLALQTEAPFDIGDWIVVDGEPRQVLEMTWRATYMRNSLGVDFREPNGNLANARIQNLGSGAVPMGFEIEVNVGYGVPPRRVVEALETAARSSPAVVASPPPVGLLTAFGDSGIVYRVRFWSTQVGGVTRLLAEVRARVWYELRRQGFPIPFPLRTVEYSSAREIAEEQAVAHRRCGEELFARVQVLAALPPEVRTRLAGAAVLRHYDAGEKLVAEGDRGDSLFVLARGRVSVSKSGSEIGTTSVALATLGPGDCFGEMSLLTGAPRTATVSAQEAVEVLVLDRAALAPVLQQDPSLAETLSHVLATRVAATVARFEDRRDELKRQAVPEHHGLLEKIRDFFRLD